MKLNSHPINQLPIFLLKRKGRRGGTTAAPQWVLEQSFLIYHAPASWPLLFAHPSLHVASHTTLTHRAVRTEGAGKPLLPTQL